MLHARLVDGGHRQNPPARTSHILSSIVAQHTLLLRYTSCTEYLDDCRVLTQRGVITVHNLTVEACQHMCTVSNDCIVVTYASMTITKNEILQSKLQTIDELAAPAACAILNVQGFTLEGSQARTCHDCIKHCSTMEACTSIIFNGTLLHRDQLQACDPVEPSARAETASLEEQEPSSSKRLGLLKLPLPKANLRTVAPVRKLTSILPQYYGPHGHDDDDDGEEEDD